VDVAIVDLYRSMPENRWTNSQAKAIFRQMGERMGQLPLQNGEPSPRDARFSGGGNIQRNGQLLTFHVFFDNAFEGAPAFAAWLDSKGCKDLKYQWYGAGSYDDEDY
jgi:hypothetical protein